MLLRDTILVVDGSSASRTALCKTFENQFNILEAGTLTQGKLLFEQNRQFIAAVLLDICLTDGKAAEELYAVNGIGQGKIPFIGVVDSHDMRHEHRAFQLGATDVIFRPIHSIAAERRVCNLIDLYRNKWTLEDMVAEQSAVLRSTNEAMVDALSSIIECRSVESGQHVLRIRRLTQILLEELARSCPEYDLTEGTIQSISSAAALHDIGKISIPDAILNKPGPLTAEEFEVMKTHTVEGGEILARLGDLVDREYLAYAYNICRYHHERWDGSGYPEGRAGEDIPLCAQVVGLADAYDALTNDRVYKKNYSGAVAASMILNGDCGSFSPVLLECFKLVQEELEQLAAAYAEGQSPRNDGINAPPLPVPPMAVSALQKLTARYNALLHYLDATVVDLDLDQRSYHITYNPDPDFNFVVNADGRDMSLLRWTANTFYPDGASAAPEKVWALLEEFLVSGRRQQSFPITVRGQDGRCHPYTATLLRPEAEERKLTLVCRKEDPALLDGQEADLLLKRAGVGLVANAQCCIYDRWLTMPEVRRELADLTGYTVEEIQTQFHSRLLELVTPENREGLRQDLERQMSHSPECEIEFPLARKDGQTAWVVGKGILSIGADRREQLYLVLVDITATRQDQERLRQELEQQQLILSRAGDIVFELDLVADRLNCSSKWAERFGYEPISEQVSEKLSYASHFHPDDIEVLQKKLDQLRMGKPFVECTLRVADSSGRYRWNRMRAVLRVDDRQRPVSAVGVFIDIDNEQRASRAMQISADRDMLTRLLNKQAARREVEAYLNDRETDTLSALAIIDLDNFKEVNDRYGHMFGDEILTGVSAEIGRMFRGADVVGRIGGDEFLVFLPAITDKAVAEDRFQLLIDNVRGFLGQHGLNDDISCSVGIAFSPEHGRIYEELFQRADRALYRAKYLGKSRIYVYTAADPTGLPTMVSKRIDSDEPAGIGGNSLIGYVFERLYESGDTMGTICDLMELVGRQVGVSRVYIFENNPDNTLCNNTFEWCAEGVEPQIEFLQNVSYEEDIAGYRELYNERGILYSPDIAQLPPNIQAILEPQGIKSMLHCAIRERGQFRGYVGFDDNTKVRLWTQEQIDLLTFLAQLLSVFLLKRRAHQRTDDLVRDLQALLDKQPYSVYVVDEKNWKLRFLNGKLVELEPGAKVGDYCYQALKGQDHPCEECPIQAEGGACTIHNLRRDLWLEATAGPIHWEDRPAWLISCQEIKGWSGKPAHLSS